MLGQLRRSKCRGVSKFRHDEGTIDASTQSRDYVVSVTLQVVCYTANMTGALPNVGILWLNKELRYRLIFVQMPRGIPILVLDCQIRAVLNKELYDFHLSLG